MKPEEIQFVVKLIALQNALEKTNKICIELYQAFDDLRKRGKQNANTQRDTQQITFNCVELKSIPCITTDEINECIKSMKKIPTLMDILEKRGEHNANSQRDTEPSKDIQIEGSK